MKEKSKLDYLNNAVAKLEPGESVSVSLSFIRDYIQSTFVYKVGFTHTWQENFEMWDIRNRVNVSEWGNNQVCVLTKKWS